MSGETSNLTSAPAEPKSPPPKRYPSKRKPSRSRDIILVALAGLAVTVVTFLVFKSRRQTSASATGTPAFRTVAVVRGNFVKILRATGTTQAVKSFSIIAPQLAGARAGELTIIRLSPNGAKVKRGDLLVEFDPQTEIKNYLDNRAKWMDLIDQVAKQQATDAAALTKDETNIQTAEDDLKTAQLEMQKLELLSRIDQEITHQQLIEAQASLKELRQTYKLKLEELTAESHDLELQRDQARRDMLHAKENQNRMAIRSPISGVVVLHSIWKGETFATVTEGDQVRPGMGFMEVVDPSAMEVSAKVNQMDVAGLESGEQAEVLLDAYPGLVLPAKLETLGPIATNGQFSNEVRTFDALFSVQAADPRLMPDLSAAVDVELVHQKGALMIPNDCIVHGQGGPYVYVKLGRGFRKRRVKLGPQNNLVTVIASGLKAREAVRRGVGQGDSRLEM